MSTITIIHPARCKHCEHCIRTMQPSGRGRLKTYCVVEDQSETKNYKYKEGFWKPIRLADLACPKFKMF